MTTISASTVLSSQLKCGKKRLTTLLLRYPRWIHSEFMTHRAISKNAGSSRAIPIEKLIQSALDEPAMPIFWGANQRGMQAETECDETISFIQELDNGNTKLVQMSREEAWYYLRDEVIQMVRAFDQAGYHKQVANRWLEPFTHITVLASSTEWSNFLALRNHGAAEPHFQMLAKAVKTELDKPMMQILEPGDWHMPFVTDQDRIDAVKWAQQNQWSEVEALQKLSVARCASTSYKTVEGHDMSFENAVRVYQKLVGDHPIHASPAEHVARADSMKDGRWKWRHQHRNFNGFRQLRAMIPNDTL